MIFVSKFERYKVVAVKGGFDRLTNVELGGGYIAEFKADVTTPMMEMLRAKMEAGELRFNGLPRDPSTNADIDPVERCSSFDSEWVADPELRGKVEQALLHRPDFGKDYWLLEETAKPAPWPAYDKLVPQGRRTIEMAAEKIALMTLEMGLEPEGVIAYERENANRPQVLEALEALRVAEAEEEVVSA